MTWAVFPNDKYRRAVVELLTEAAKPSGSERIIAVVGGALLEQAVNTTLRERLKDDPEVVKNLVGPEKSLGNIAPQIDLLYLLGAFDDRTRKALKGLARIRNFFAHRTDASFDSLDKDFADAVKWLVLHEGKTYYPHHLFGADSKEPIEPVTSRRDQFVVNLKLGLIALMGIASVITITQISLRQKRNCSQLFPTGMRPKASSLRQIHHRHTPVLKTPMRLHWSCLSSPTCSPRWLLNEQIYR